MATDMTLVLFSAQGVMNQLQIARIVMVRDNYPTTALDAVIASVATLIALVDVPVQDEPVDPNAPCSHPVEKRKRTAMPGDNWFETCTLCGDMVAQGSDS